MTDTYAETSELIRASTAISPWKRRRANLRHRLALSDMLLNRVELLQRSRAPLTASLREAVAEFTEKSCPTEITTCSSAMEALFEEQDRLLGLILRPRRRARLALIDEAIEVAARMCPCGCERTAAEGSMYATPTCKYRASRARRAQKDRLEAMAG